MAHLWRREPDDDQWAVLPLDGEAGLIDEVVLLPTNGERGSSWVLVTDAHAEVGINGLTLKAGIRVLTDRDEIRINERGGGRVISSRPKRWLLSSLLRASLSPAEGAGCSARVAKTNSPPAKLR